MTDHITIFAVSGSLRRESYNSKLLRAAESLQLPGVGFDHYERLAELPLYNQDEDGESAPEPIRDLRSRIAAADAVLIATPEYNYSIPGGLKNAIDWASRPPKSSVLLHKWVAIMGAAPGNFGTVRAQLAMRQSFLWIDARVLTRPEVMVFHARERFDDDGNLIDETTRSLLHELVTALVEAARSARQ